MADRGGAVNVVAVAALEQALRYPVVIRSGEVGFGRGVASVAEVGLFFDQQVLGFLGMMRRMAVDAPNIIAGMGGTREVPLLMAFAVAAQAASARLLAREVLESDDLANISSPRNVLGSGSVTTFTSMSVLEGRLEVGGRLKVFVVELFMAGLAYIGANIFGRRLAWLCIFLLLTSGHPWFDQPWQHEASYNQAQNLFVFSLPFHDPHPLCRTRATAVSENRCPQVF